MLSPTDVATEQVGVGAVSAYNHRGTTPGPVTALDIAVHGASTAVMCGVKEAANAGLAIGFN